MKKTTLLQQILLLAGLAAYSAGSWASDGTVTVNGQVNSNTCTIVGNGVSGSSSFTVALPPTTVSKLASAGAVDGATPFTIGVTGCGSGAGATTVNTFFESGSSVNANGRLNNTGGTASNVEAQILAGASGTTVVTLGTGSNTGNGTGTGSTGSSSTSISGGTATQTYRVQYYSKGSATAGTFSATFTYTLIYT